VPGSPGFFIFKFFLLLKSFARFSAKAGEMLKV
jgi:hypothetical protein